MRIIDLSKTIRHNNFDPKFMRVSVKHKKHAKSKFIIRAAGLPTKLFPQGFAGWADDKINMGVHATTHLDAPWHYGETCEGERAKYIDEIPLEWCFAPGKLIDVSQKDESSPIEVKDLEKALAVSQIQINPMDIVLIYTGCDKHIDSAEYYNRGPGVSKEATEWILDKGVKVIGIDQWGFDAPLKKQITQAKNTNDSELFWNAHLVGKRKEYIHLEQLVNLGALPASGFMIAVFPLKIEGGSAAPVRAVAIFQ